MNRERKLTGLRCLAAVLSGLLATSVHAGEENFDVKKELSSDYLKDMLGKDVALYLADEAIPQFLEMSRPEIYTAMSFSPSPFGGGRRHCLDAFQKAMKSLVDAAVAHGYDAVVDIRPVNGSEPSKDVGNLKCTPGYKITSVSMLGTLAMSASAAHRRADEEKRSINLPPRSPAEGSIFMPIGPVMASPEAAQILADGVSMHWGAQAPDYRYRYGPDDHSDQAEVTSAGAEAACKVAALKVLRSIADEAKERKYDSIIKLRSRLEGEYAPVPDELECQIGKKKVYVTIQATLAQKK